MERRKDQVTCLGCMKCRLKGLAVAHLADEDNVGILTQGSSESWSKPRHIDTDFTLTKAATLIGKEVLNGILEGNHVEIGSLVEVTEQSGEGRALTRTSRSADKHDAVTKLSELSKGWIEMDLSKRRRRRLNQAQDSARRAALLEGIDAVTSASGGHAVESVVNLMLGEPSGTEKRREGGLDKAEHLFGGEWRHLGGHQSAVDAEERRTTGL